MNTIIKTRLRQSVTKLNDRGKFAFPFQKRIPDTIFCKKKSKEKNFPQGFCTGFLVYGAHTEGQFEISPIDGVLSALEM